MRVIGGRTLDTLTTREAARILGVSRRTFNRWIGTHAVERETSYGASGVEYRYTRSALEHLVHQVRGGEGVSQLDEGMPTGRASQPAQGRQDETAGAGQDEAPARVLALPAVEVLRPFVEEVGALREEVRQLREVLVSLRLPDPSTPTAVCVSAIETDEDVDAADELFRSVVPRVLARIQDARFVVVAKQPPPSIRRLEQIAGVVVAGFRCIDAPPAPAPA